MTDKPPDRLSTDPTARITTSAARARHRHSLRRQEKTNVEEYCVSEGWIRVAAGKALDRKGKPLTIKLKGPVEPFFQDTIPEGDKADLAARPPLFTQYAPSDLLARASEHLVDIFPIDQAIDRTPQDIGPALR